MSTQCCQQLVGIEVHITQHAANGIALNGVIESDPALIINFHIHRIGITKQVVQIAENFLIRTDHENAQLGIRAFRHRQRGFQTFAIDVLINTAIRVTGNILQHRPAGRHPVESGQRQNRENLVNAPDIRHRLEYRKIDKQLVGQLFVQLIEQSTLMLARRIETAANGQLAIDIQALGNGPLRQ